MTIDNHDNVIFSILYLAKSKKYFIFAIQMAKNKDNHLFKWQLCKNVQNCTRQYGR